MARPAEKAVPAHESVARIVQAATRLFAEHGFHGVTTRQISAATGLNVATIHHHVGTKRNLYLRVIEALFEQEETVIGGLIDRIGSEALADRRTFRSAVNRLIEGIVQLARSHPDRQRLYVRRWLEDDDELREREAELTLRLYRRLADFIRAGQRGNAVRSDVDVDNFLRSFDWLIMGYFTSGAFDWQTLRVDPFEGERLHRFTEFLQDYAARMLGLAEENRHGD